MIGFLRQRKRALDDWLVARGLSHTVSLPAYLLSRELDSRLERFHGGTVLDAGSGRSPFRARLLGMNCAVTSVDVEDRSGQLDIVADIQDMPHVASDSFDGVLCTQVLEHVRRPWAALGELARVLKPGGILILSVPHLSPLHEEPHDYFRFTKYALVALSADSGLEVEEICEVGGLVAFLVHGFSSVVVSLAAGVPLAGRLVWAANFLFFVRMLSPIDRSIGLRRTFPCNYLLVARKPAGRGN